MKRRPFLRALITGAAAMLVILLAFLWLRGPQAPEQALPEDVDLTQFVAGRPRLDAPYVATDTEVVDAMLGIAQVRPNDYVIDLGSGDGRILIAAARSLGARGLGVDIDPARIREATANARSANVSGRITFRREDLFQTPLAEADVLTLYLAPDVNLRLRPRILAEMRPGTRVVSHDFDMAEWRPDQRRRAGSATVYLWLVPARVEGNWTLSESGRTIPLALDQQFQVFIGTAAVGDREVRIEQGMLTGERIRFLADLGGGRRVYEGRVQGDAVLPIDPRAGWRMARAS